MRHVTILARGRFVSDAMGGSKADVALGHAARSLAEFAVALDAFEEDTADLAAAAEHHSAVIAAASRETVIVATSSGSEERTYITLPDDLDHAIQYWERRQMLHGKSAVMALDQLRRSLETFAKLSKLPVAQDAVEAFDDAFPALKHLRNSLAHADERASGGSMSIGRRRDGPIRLTDLLTNIGYCDGDAFVMRQKDAAAVPARLPVTEVSFLTAFGILQSLVLQTPFRLPLAKLEPLMAPLAG